MLKDSEITSLKKDKAYKRETEIGLNRFSKDLIRGEYQDIKPDVSIITKLAFTLLKSFYIRKELYYTSSTLIESALNYELMWAKNPESIRYICESDAVDFLWMRYDESRVNGLFHRSLSIFDNPAFRHLIKTHSTITKDKNLRFSELRNELKKLHDDTVFSIRSRGLFNDWIKIKSDQYYKENEDVISKKMLDNAFGGSLGKLPEGSNPAKGLPKHDNNE
jgi:hypothetical protein